MKPRFKKCPALCGSPPRGAGLLKDAGITTHSDLTQDAWACRTVSGPSGSAVLFPATWPALPRSHAKVKQPVSWQPRYIA